MPSTPEQQDACPHSRARFFRGARLGLPIFLGYVPVGAAFGVLARSWGFEPLQAIVCSATAFAGAGQFIGLSMMNAGAAVLTVLAATTVVNLRHVLFGATLAPHLSGSTLPVRAALAFSVTDETFAVNIDDQRRGLADAASMAGVGAVAWLGWVLGTILGAVGGTLIGDPGAWGVDFAMPAMFSALLVAQAENRPHVETGVVAAVLALVLALLLPGRWYVVAASVVAAAIGAARHR